MRAGDATLQLLCPGFSCFGSASILIMGNNGEQGCPGACLLLTCQLLLLNKPRCGGHKVRLIGLVRQLSDDNGRPYCLVLACLQHAETSMQKACQKSKRS